MAREIYIIQMEIKTLILAAIIISGRVDFKSKAVKKIKEHYCIDEKYNSTRNNNQKQVWPNQDLADT